MPNFTQGVSEEGNFSPLLSCSLSLPFILMKERNVQILDAISERESGSWGVSWITMSVSDSAYSSLSLIFSPTANVTLDPDTAHPKLILSEDGKSVRWGEKPQALPDNPERFRRYSCVLGREGFTTGSHFWEVTVKSGEYWALGVARKSVERKGSFSLSFLDFCPCPEGGIWAVGKSGGKYWAYSSPFPSPLSLSEEPRRIRVTLDCEGGHVSFYAADSGAELYTFSGASFSGETLLPFFLLWENYKIWDLLRRIS
ncbi:finger RFP-like [Podarcis lilfordi]|uniref:Finger RFP-like n=1 Tax=Podarcis lilfordi TaxID=74358 RepID=A0AA35K143_9SAUR|nr:finger RFP-like [Podarcis lilfordi]